MYQEDDLSEETIAALISQLELAEATEVLIVTVHCILLCDTFLFLLCCSLTT